MDTPESPTQSPQSPEEEEKGLSDSELLESPDEEEGKNVVESQGRHLELEEEDDEVVPDFVSDPEDEEPFGETGGIGQEDETIVLKGGGEGSPQEREGKEEEERVANTPLSPDSEPEHLKSFKKEEDRAKRYDDYNKTVEQEAARVNDEEEEYKNKDDEDERMQAEETRSAAAVREMKDDSVSVSRELDEHELDYDEEVPEDPSLPAHEEDEEDTKADEDEEDSEDKSNKKKEKKSILPPSPKDSGRTDGSKGPERIRRDSFRDKKKDEDDGEIDEGEIDDDDLEEGEVKDPSDRKIRPRPICRFFIKVPTVSGTGQEYLNSQEDLHEEVQPEL